MGRLINAKRVKAIARDLTGKPQVGQSFLDAIEAEVRQAIERRAKHHDNKCGSRRRAV